MQRRDFVAGLGVFGAALAAGQVRAQEAARRAKPARTLPPVSKELRAMLDASATCISSGHTCLARCTDHLEAGAANMAECQRGVMNMLAVTEALHKVASYRTADGAALKALARSCAEFCRACEKSCAPHAAHHAECKACMEACKACAKACDDFAKV